MGLGARERRVEALVHFLGELLGGAASGRRGALELLAGVYAQHCLEPVVGVSTPGALERELSLAYALARRGLGLGEELEGLGGVFRVERRCEEALAAVLAGAGLREALERAGARLSDSWVRALLGYARALHYLGYMGDEELASLLRAVEGAGVGAHALRFTRRLVAAHRLAQEIAWGRVASRGAKERRKSALALLYGGGVGDKPPDPLVWQVAVNVYGLDGGAPLRLLRVRRRHLWEVALASASWWYCGVASPGEVEEALSQLGEPWLRAYEAAVEQLSRYTPGAGPIALALLEQAALEGLSPEGFLEKLGGALASGSLAEGLLAWDACGWRASLLPLPTGDIEVRLLRGHEMVVVCKAPAWDALEAGVRGLAGSLRARLEEALPAGLRGRVSGRWLRLASLLLAIELIGTALELPPGLRERRRPAVLLAERAEVEGVEVSVEVVRRRGRRYLAASLSGRRIASVRLGSSPSKAADKLLRALDHSMPKSVKPEVRAALQQLLQRVAERVAEAGWEQQAPCR
jgi:hypothetical protein